ncbi:MAG: glycosyltransferase family 2 protein [Rikenellaceae bacterium]|nr:glycosyltransferase family 2 protein [Rikenellaceae bacterium]
MGKALTVFTPAYNRAALLGRAYESLVRQTNKDFEWIVVNDGSTDETVAVMQRFIDEGKLDITYVRQPNGGKHRAINKGVESAGGYLFMILDSDDYLSDDNVVADIVSHIPFLESDDNFCAVVGNKIHEDGNVIGTSTDKEVIDTNFLDYREKYRIKGDRAEIIKTSVMRQYPFPEIEGEKFCSEGLVWNRMAQRYKARYVNRPYMKCEYLPGGLSDSIKRLRSSSPEAFMNFYAEYVTYGVPLKSKIKNAMCYWAVFFKSRKKWAEAVRRMGIYTIFMPAGWLLHKTGRL